jgi:hypothetical protein
MNIDTVFLTIGWYPEPMRNSILAHLLKDEPFYEAWLRSKCQGRSEFHTIMSSWVREEEKRILEARSRLVPAILLRMSNYRHERYSDHLDEEHSAVWFHQGPNETSIIVWRSYDLKTYAYYEDLFEEWDYERVNISVFVPKFDPMDIPHEDDPTFLPMITNEKLWTPFKDY